MLHPASNFASWVDVNPDSLVNEENATEPIAALFKKSLLCVLWLINILECYEKYPAIRYNTKSLSFIP